MHFVITAAYECVPKWDASRGAHGLAAGVAMTTQEVMHELYGALAAQDMDRATALFADDITHRVFTSPKGAPFNGLFEGAAAASEQFRTVDAGWRIRRMDVRDLVVDGSRAACTVSVDAVGRDGQRPITTEATHFVTVKDGRITEFDVFFISATSLGADVHKLERRDVRDTAVHSARSFGRRGDGLAAAGGRSAR